jgi:hypothetical protein
VVLGLNTDSRPIATNSQRWQRLPLFDGKLNKTIGATGLERALMRFSTGGATPGSTTPLLQRR